MLLTGVRAAELISCQRPSLKTKHKCYKQNYMMGQGIRVLGDNGLIEKPLDKNTIRRLSCLAPREATVARPPRWGDRQTGDIFPASNTTCAKL